MSDIRTWLEGLGFAEYTETFATHKVDADVLPELTNEDLKDLGIPLGHRKKLLKAIETFSATIETNAAEATPRVPGAKAPRAPAAGAERRHLTVMFCDLVSSTALSTRFDPEDLREIILSFQRCCEQRVERFGGYVARFMGDGLLAYFGYPQAHEDDAERAVKAGLSIVAAVHALEPYPGIELQVRVGIATGHVVAGDSVGEGGSEEKAALGDTPNLAARLQALAAPDAVMIASSTRRLTGKLFTYEDTGSHQLKGFPEQVQAWRVVAEASNESRFAATRSPEGTALVGRETEVLLLLDRWERTKDTEGQVVLLSGEPGIGKSRLAYAFLERISADSHCLLQYQCSPHYTNSAFYPFIEHIQRAAGFAFNEASQSKLAKLESWISEAHGSVRDVVPLLAALLSISTAGDCEPLHLNPQRQKEKTVEALTQRCVAVARRAPLLLLFEDVHWADPTTLDVLSVIIDAAASEAMLLIITHRPQFTPPWQGRGHVTAHSLTRLGKRQMTGIVEGVTGGKPLPDAVLDEIIAKTDGVPLFVEELTKAVLEAGFLTDAGTCYTLDGPLPPLSVPSTLQDSLVARLDRLTSVKHVAQVAAAIGREFSYPLLAAICKLGDAALRDALSQLEQAELIYRRGTPPEATYSFKHALVQDAAHDSLLKRRRKELHAELAAVLEARFPQTVRLEPELLAHHYTVAGVGDKAVGYWHRAAQRALDRYAYPEALAHHDAALESLQGLAETRERHVRELELQIARGGALMVSKGYVAPETEAAFARAYVLSLEVGDDRQIFTVLRALHGVHFVRAELDKALELGRECLRMAAGKADPQPLALAHRLVGQTLCMNGTLSPAREHLQQALALDSAPRAGDVAALVHGGGHRLMTPAFLAQALWLQGFPDQALAHARNALLEAEQYGAFTVTASMFFLCWIHGWRREYGMVEELAEKLRRLAGEHGISAWASTAELFPDWAQLACGAPGERASLARKRLPAVRALPGQMTPFKLGLLAGALSASSGTEAVNVVDEGLALTEQTGERWSEAELLRIKGQAQLDGGESTAVAEASFLQALDVARRQGARSFELRTAIDLARLWFGRDKHEDAHALLAPIYAWFSEGFETRDLQQAKMLLEQRAR